jgi:hypothetical protein
MSYTRPTGGTNSPFATSTTYTTTGASAYSQTWVSTSFSSGWIASISGRGIATNAAQGNLQRYYWNSANNFPQSGQAYYTFYQSFVASSDECIDVGNSFQLSVDASLDSATGRTNIMRVSF